VDKFFKTEIISYESMATSEQKTMEQLKYFVKWKGCSQDENTWEPVEHLGHAEELVDQFHIENLEIPRLGEVVFL